MNTLQADPDIYRVWATCHVDNERSARLLERAEFTREGRLVRHGIYPNLGTEPLDSLLFAKALR
jgi:[ribosomal protein S5]-alanine N-acetyltransferase